LKEGGELEGYGCVNRMIERYEEKLPGRDWRVCIAFLSVQLMGTVPLLPSRRGQGWSLALCPLLFALCVNPSDIRIRQDAFPGENLHVVGKKSRNA
jgi:hypothetical protein